MEEPDHPLRSNLRQQNLLTISDRCGFSFTDIALQLVSDFHLELLETMRDGSLFLPLKGTSADESFGMRIEIEWLRIVKAWSMRWIDCETLMNGLQKEQRRAAHAVPNKRKPKPSKNAKLVEFALPKLECETLKEIVGQWNTRPSNRNNQTSEDALRMALKRAEEKPNK